MNFEEEGWVKLFCRKSPRWLAMPWQSRALYPLLMKDVDRRGVFDSDGLDLVTAVSIAVALPPEVVEVGIAGLVAMKSAHMDGGALVLTNFARAQGARTSDAERKRRQRGREAEERSEVRAESMPQTCIKNVEKVAVPSHDVTRRHAESHDVTIRSDQIRRDQKRSPLPPVDAGAPERAVTESGFFDVRDPDVTAELDRGVTERQHEYQGAYERGIAAGKGAPYAMDRKQRGELHQAIQAHAKSQRPERLGHALRGDDLVKWIELAATDFAEWLIAKPDKVSFYSSFGPRGFLKYLNEDVRAGEARRVG